MAASLRIAMVAGEPSGDLLGARVIDALAAHGVELRVEGIGGEQMIARGCVSHAPLERLSVMGLTEPLRRLPELLAIRRALLRRYRDDPPDLFLGIDAPEFNLDLERQLRAAGVTTAHLVSPSVWAWRKARLQKIAKGVDRMLCLFPFETEVYEQRAIPVQFVGHPLADELPLEPDRAGAREALGLYPAGALVALLPGSRAGEVAHMAPLFLQTAARLRDADPSLSFVLPAATPALHRQIEAMLEGYPGLSVTLVQGRSREALTAADLVLSASGTATLEAALLQRPMVVAYRMGQLSWAVLSRLVRVPWVSLPNLIAGREVVPEYLQSAATADRLAAALQGLLADAEGRADMATAFRAMRSRLQANCAGQVAATLLHMVEAK